MASVIPEGRLAPTTSYRPTTTRPNYNNYAGGYDPRIASQPADQRRYRGDMYTSGSGLTTQQLNAMRQQMGITTGGGSSSGGGGGSRGGGGGGGYSAPNYAGMMDLFNRRPGQMTWRDLEFTPYDAPDFYAFDRAIYDRSRRGLGEAISADRSAGAAAYGQGMRELQQYRDPFSGAPQTTNPARAAAMQRMLEANNVSALQNQDETDRGVQADQAFGNLLNVLSAVSGQSQDSRVRALQGDERAFNEGLDAEQRGGNLMVDMQEAAALRQYEQDKWMYGEQVARMNYENNRAVAQYNNQGQNQTAQTNTQQNNAFNQENIQAILQILASGGKIDPRQYTGV